MERRRTIRDRIVIACVLSTIAAVLFFALTSGTPIDRYQPRPPDEQQILTLIKRFHSAGQTRNLTVYSDCLSDGGQFMLGSTRMLSKDELMRALPGFWSDLALKNAAGPVSRESMTGAWLKGDLYDPVIKITGRTADAAVKFVVPGSRWTIVWFLGFENTRGRWQVSRSEWDMG